jgi:hypothetical protein
MNFIKHAAILGSLGLLGVAAYIWQGVYPVGADVSHNKITYWLLESVRERSIARASKYIEVPLLDEPDLLLAGGQDYNEMCASCHLKPGKLESDLSIGLYPSPPNLSLTEAGDNQLHGQGSGSEEMARRQFWIIKHGIKASGMPAWGPTHDDQRIWAMVAFLQKLPQLTPDQYQILTTRSDNDSQSHH